MINQPIAKKIQICHYPVNQSIGDKGQVNRGTNLPRDKTTEGQDYRGTRLPRDKTTEGQVKSTKGQVD